MGYYEMILLGALIVGIPAAIIGFVADWNNKQYYKEKEQERQAQAKTA